MEPFWTNLVFWMYLFAGLPFGLFVGFYAVRSPGWKRTPVGRGLMLQAASLASTFFYICLLLAVDVPKDIKDMLRTVLIGGVTIAGWLMFRNLLIEQRKQNEE